MEELKTKVPSYSEMKKAVELIKEAISLGVLTDNEDHEYVYLNVQLPNGSIVWQAYPILEAAINLVQSDNVGLLEAAVEENRTKGEGYENNNKNA